MAPSSAYGLSIVVPAYREAPRIPGTIAAILAFFDALSVSCEVIVVDDGSDDGTCDAVDRAAASDRRVKLLRLPEHRGKGAAVRAGLLASAGAFVLVIDADLAIPLEEYPAFARSLAGGADVAIASKELGRRLGLVDRPFLRSLMGRVFNAMVRFLVLPGFLDTQAGFKLFKGPVARTLASDCRTNGFAYDVEILSLALRRGYNIVELPVRCRLARHTSVRVFLDSLRMLRDLISIRRRIGRRGGPGSRDAETR